MQPDKSFMEQITRSPNDPCLFRESNHVFLRQPAHAGNRLVEKLPALFIFLADSILFNAP